MSARNWVTVTISKGNMEIFKRIITEKKLVANFMESLEGGTVDPETMEKCITAFESTPEKYKEYLTNKSIKKGATDWIEENKRQKEKVAEQFGKKEKQERTPTQKVFDALEDANIKAFLLAFGIEYDLEVNHTIKGRLIDFYMGFRHAECAQVFLRKGFANVYGAINYIENHDWKQYV